MCVEAGHLFISLVKNMGGQNTEEKQQNKDRSPRRI